MEIPNYESNSYKAREQRKREAEAQEESTPTVKEESSIDRPIRKRSSFLSNSFKSIGEYVIGDVLIPAVKKAISDIVTNGIDMLLYGNDPKNRPSKHSRYGDSYVSYRDYSTRRRDDRDSVSYSSRDKDRYGRYNYSYEDISFDNRGDAEMAMIDVFDLIDRYDVMSISDLIEISEKIDPDSVKNIPRNYTDENYGWKKIDRNCHPIRSEGRYFLDLPKASPLK